MGLEITEDGRKISVGYSPFTAENYYIDLPTDASSSYDEEKEDQVQSE